MSLSVAHVYRRESALAGDCVYSYNRCMYKGRYVYTEILRFATKSCERERDGEYGIYGIAQLFGWWKFSCSRGYSAVYAISSRLCVYTLSTANFSLSVGKFTRCTLSFQFFNFHALMRLCLYR